MNTISKQIAAHLLDLGAVKIRPEHYFTWASGWHSPIYCDNRMTLSHPIVRDAIRDAFARRVRELYPETDIIAGVATGAIAIGALVAQELNLPFVYVRSAPKGHGLENLIEGDITVGQNVLVIEDLVSTGGSSLQAVNALRLAGLEVLGMLAIFTYGFPVAEGQFKAQQVQLNTLSDYTVLLETALQKNMIQESQLISLNEWRTSPETWKK
jgi:orotate phosphoribosyltransferase